MLAFSFLVPYKTKFVAGRKRMIFNRKSVFQEHIDEDLDSLKNGQFLDHCSSY